MAGLSNANILNPVLAATLFGNEAEHSDTDYGFEHVGGTVLQGRNGLDFSGGTSEPSNFVVTGSSTSFELLRSAVSASEDSNRGQIKEVCRCFQFGGCTGTQRPGFGQWELLTNAA